MTAPVTVRLFAAAKAAAGTGSTQVPAGSLAEVLDALRAAHGPGLARVLEVCSYLLDERSVGERDHEQVVVGPGAVVDVLPPFAGG